MKFKNTLISGTLVRRYKRFLVDVRLENGEVLTAHCPNSGSMKSCIQEGWKIRLSYHDNKNRKYPYTWEMVHNGRCWIGINTGMPNVITEEAVRAGKISEVQAYTEIRREVKYGINSRIDLLLKNRDQLCYVEVKNVTLVEEDGNYYFPDSVTDRGRKHLYELKEMVQQGHRALMFYVIQRKDGRIFKPAAHIDHAYAKSLEEVHKFGVEIAAYRASVSPEEITIIEKVPWQLD